MIYQPGLHILSEFDSKRIDRLSAHGACRLFFDGIVRQHGLAKVGEVYHDFEGGGFTAVVCLTESHLSIHTWPEFGLATFDVFLSNYQKNNTEKVKAICQQVLEFFEATERQHTELIR